MQLALQFIQQVQRLQGAQRVYLRPADDIRHGALGHALQGYLVLPRRRGVGLPGLALQLPQDLPRPLEHRVRQARQLGYLDAVAPVRTAGDDLPQKDDILAPGVDGHVVVPHVGQFLLQRGQLMIMGGEQRLGLQLPGAVLQHRPGNGHSVECRRTPADLIQNEQAVLRGAAKQLRHLGHLHHEGRLSRRQVVAGADAGENAVHHADVRPLGGDKAPHLGHQHDQRHLAHIGGLTGHVWTGDDGHPVLLCAHVGVVGHKERVASHLFHHRMASRRDLDDPGLVHLRPAVVVLGRHLGKGTQRVQLRDQRCRQLHPRHLSRRLCPQRGEQVVFQCRVPVMGGEHLMLQILQLLGDIALAVHQRLLAYVVRRHLVLKGVAHLDIVPEHLVVPHLQGTDAGLFLLTGLQLRDKPLAAGEYPPQPVHLIVIALADHAALPDGERRLVYQHGGNAPADVLQRLQLLVQLSQPEARNELEYILSKDKNNYLIWEELLLMCNEMGDTTCMYRHGIEAIKYFPEQPLPYALSGIALMMQKQFAEALPLFEKGVELTDDKPELRSQFYSYLADCYYNLDSVERAFKMFDEVLKINPNDILVLNNYAYYLSLRNERLALAEKMSSQAVAMESDNATYLDTYAWVLYKRGEYSQARYYIKLAIEKDKDPSGVLYEHYGDILYRSGEHQEALKMWKKAAEMGGGVSEELNDKIQSGKLSD